MLSGVWKSVADFSQNSIEMTQFSRHDFRPPVTVIRVYTRRS